MKVFQGKKWPDGEAGGRGKMSSQTYYKFIKWKTWMFIPSFVSVDQKFFTLFSWNHEREPCSGTGGKPDWLDVLVPQIPVKMFVSIRHIDGKKNWSTTKVSGIYPLGSVPNFMAIHPDLVWTKLVDWPSDSLTLPKKLKKELW